MSEPVTIATKLGKTRLAFEVGIFSVLVFLSGYLILYSDRHNDERYVSLAEYSKDRKNDAELRSMTNSGVTWRMDQQDKKLDEISADIKALLRRQP